MNFYGNPPFNFLIIFSKTDASKSSDNIKDAEDGSIF
jgi:hypothetical protein